MLNTTNTCIILHWLAGGGVGDFYPARRRREISIIMPPTAFVVDNATTTTCSVFRPQLLRMPRRPTGRGTLHDGEGL